jgi:outer membrane protein assembly factor BamB
VIHGANSITGAYAAGYLWVAYGEGTVTCADARTGRKLGTLTDGSISGSADIVTVSGRPMTVIDSTLFVIDEQIACS